jgi:hypothetical protein
MTIQAVNITSGTLTYSNESVTVPANSAVTVSSGILSAFANDPNVLSDIYKGNLNISDTVNTYTYANAVQFLTSVLLNDLPVTGTITSNGGSVSLFVRGSATVALYVTGTFSGNLVTQVSPDGINWEALNYYIPGQGQFDIVIANLMGIMPVSGWNQMRIFATSWTSGTATVSLNAGTGNYLSQIYSTLYSDVLGTMKITDGTNVAAVKAASTAAIATDTAQVVAISPNNSVAVTQTIAANLNATVIGPTLTKGTQGSAGFSIQELKDAGRNVTNYFMASQVVSTSSEVLQSLTGYKGGVAVAATTTPAVVTTGKTYRISTISITYVGISTAGSVQVNLRANLSGVSTVTSPLVNSWLVGTTAATAGVSSTEVIDIPDGMEFAAGTGIGITVLGIGATGTAAAVGYAKVQILGYEY